MLRRNSREDPGEESATDHYGVHDVPEIPEITKIRIFSSLHVTILPKIVLGSNIINFLLTQSYDFTYY